MYLLFRWFDELLMYGTGLYCDLLCFFFCTALGLIRCMYYTQRLMHGLAVWKSPVLMELSAHVFIHLQIWARNSFCKNYGYSVNILYYGPYVKVLELWAMLGAYKCVFIFAVPY